MTEQPEDYNKPPARRTCGNCEWRVPDVDSTTKNWGYCRRVSWDLDGCKGQVDATWPACPMWAKRPESEDA